ncbi:MAG: hypothetical protein U0271_10565 [Polyangiaceae bacterium]
MRSFLSALVAAAFTSWVASCATPLPDPPDVDTAQMSLVAADTSVTLEGQNGALNPGGFTLRVTDTVSLTAVEVPVDAQGAFTATVLGSIDDPLWLESADSDEFLGVVGTDGGGGVVPLDSGADSDSDGSPDAVDCAPNDNQVEGSACGGVCTTDADCVDAFVCQSGRCSAN